MLPEGFQASVLSASLTSILHFYPTSHHLLRNRTLPLLLSNSQPETMSTIDLSLPQSVPEMSRYADRPMTLDSFAIYNLLEPQDEPLNLVQTCNSECPRDDYVHFRTSPGITSLKGLIDYHLSTTVHDNFDPNYFLVVTDPDWEHKGVCIVTLGDEEGKPDKFMIKAQESGLLLVNLQIGNTDWYEAKENYEFAGDDDGDDAQDSETGTVHLVYIRTLSADDDDTQKEHFPMELLEKGQARGFT